MGGIGNEAKRLIKESQKKYETEIELSVSTKPKMSKEMMKKHKGMK